MDFRQILFFNIKPIEANELNCIPPEMINTPPDFRQNRNFNRFT